MAPVHQPASQPTRKHGLHGRLPGHRVTGRLRHRVAQLKKDLEKAPTHWSARPLVMLWHAVLVGFTAIKAWSGDRCTSMAAALAFYSAFSLAPMLVVIIAVAGFFFGPEAVQGELFSDIAGLVGEDGAAVIQTMVANASKADQGALAGVLSLGAIALGASATFTQLTDALNVIWRATPRTAPLAALIRIRLTSFGLVVGIGFLLVVLLVADAALKAITRQVLVWGPWLDPIANLLQQSVSFVFLCFAFALLLKLLPDVQVRWKKAFTGAVAAALLFTGGKHLFALYLAGAGTANVIGAAGAITAVMMWLYFSAAVFLLGAEVAAHASGSRKPEKEGDKTLEADDKPALETQPALLR